MESQQQRLIIILLLGIPQLGYIDFELKSLNVIATCCEFSVRLKYKC